MENESALLERLRQHDPKVFRSVFEELIHDMIQQASQSLGNYVMGNTIVTKIWYNALDSSFEHVEPPLRKYFFDQIRIECEIARLVGSGDLRVPVVIEVGLGSQMADKISA